MIEVAATRDPPTFWTMSANTVVVVTTLRASGPGVATPELAEPELAGLELAGLGELDVTWQPASATAMAITASPRGVMRLSLIVWRISASSFPSRVVDWRRSGVGGRL